MNTRLLGLQLGFIKNANKLLGMIAGGKLPNEALSRYLSSTGMLPKVEAYAADKGLSLVEAARSMFSKSKATEKALDVMSKVTKPEPYTATSLAELPTRLGKKLDKNYSDFYSALYRRPVINARVGLKGYAREGGKYNWTDDFTSNSVLQGKPVRTPTAFDLNSPFNPESFNGAILRGVSPLKIKEVLPKNLKQIAETPTLEPVVRAKYGPHTLEALGLYDDKLNQILLPKTDAVRKAMQRGGASASQIAKMEKEVLGTTAHEVGHADTYQNKQLGNFYARNLLPLFKGFNLSKLAPTERNTFLSEALAQIRGSAGNSPGARSLISEVRQGALAKPEVFEGRKGWSYFNKKLKSLPENLQKRLRTTARHATQESYYPELTQANFVRPTTYL